LRVKKYQAVDMPEALRMIKKELGPDAVILSTRQVKRSKGAFGLLSRPILEVTAAAEIAAGRQDRSAGGARGFPGAPG
jgi:flagellar biosynthesis protein FlhF